MKLALAVPPRSPERQVLANANAARRQAEAAVAQANRDLAEFDARLEDTKRSRWAAADKLEAAKTAEREVYMQFAGNDDAVVKHCALSGIPYPKDALKEATAEAEDAARRLELGTDGRRAHVANWEIASDTLARAVRACEAAVAIVEQADLARLIAEAETLQADLIRRRMVLIYLNGVSFPDRSSEHGERLATLFNDFRLPQPGFIPVECERFKKAALDPWEACRAALLEDADAELPGAKT